MKFVLDTKDLTDGFFEETKLLGIMAPMKDYQFCWQLNKLLGIDFRINNELEIQVSKKHRNYFFAVYEYPESSTSLVHYLYNNRCPIRPRAAQSHASARLSAVRDTDQGEHAAVGDVRGDATQQVVLEESLQQLIQSIRTINGVQLVAELTNEKIRNKENLVF